MKVRVILVEGRRVLREGLRLLLERHDNIHVAGEAEDGMAAAKIAKAITADVAVLNVTLWSKEVRDVIRAVSRARTAVICLVMSHEPTFIRDLLEAGAVGCLTKDAAEEELVTAIRAVAGGKVYLSPSVTRTVLTDYAARSRPAGARRGQSGGQALSLRESEILRRIAEGQSSKEIAAELDIGLKTVDTHRRRLMQKLNRHSVAELTKAAIKLGLTSLETPI